MGTVRSIFDTNDIRLAGAVYLKKKEQVFGDVFSKLICVVFWNF